MSNSENHISRGYSLGAVDYILTPIVPEVLRAKVSVFVELYNRAEQIRHQSERLREIEEREHKRKLAEAQDLLERETKRNRFFTMSLDLLAIANFGGYILQSNPAWESTLGYSDEELKQRSGLDLAHPDDYKADAGKVRGVEERQLQHLFRSALSLQGWHLQMARLDRGPVCNGEINLHLRARYHPPQGNRSAGPGPQQGT